MKINVTQTHLRIAILVLGGILILYAVLKLAFGLNLGTEVEKNLPTVIMVGAAVIFVWNRQLWNQQKKKEQEEAEALKKQEEEAAEASSEAETPTEDPKVLPPKDGV